MTEDVEEVVGEKEVVDDLSLKKMLSEDKLIKKTSYR